MSDERFTELNLLYASCIQAHKDRMEVSEFSYTCKGIPDNLKIFSGNFDCDTCPYYKPNKEKIMLGNEDLEAATLSPLKFFVVGDHDNSNTCPSNVATSLKYSTSGAVDVCVFACTEDTSHELRTRQIIEGVNWADYIIITNDNMWESGVAKAYAHIMAEKLVMTIL